MFWLHPLFTCEDPLFNCVDGASLGVPLLPSTLLTHLDLNPCVDGLVVGRARHATELVS